MASENADRKLSFSEIEFGQREMFEKQFETVTGQQPTKDQMGFVHDRDVVVLYGDPAWDVKMQNRNR